MNFLFVVSRYARNNAAQKREWREKVRGIFRERVREMLMKRFEFYVMTPRADTEAKVFFQEHFHDLVGRIYNPYGKRGDFEYYSLALRKNDIAAKRDFSKENQKIKDLVKKGFHLSEKPLEELGTPPEKMVAGEPRKDNSAMPSYQFEKAAQAIGKDSYFINYAPGSIKLLKEAQAFLFLAGTGIKDHPKNVRTIFLVESGASNKLKAVLQVDYLREFSSFADLLAFRDGVTNCSKLAGVQTGGKGRHWLWRVTDWVDV